MIKIFIINKKNYPINTGLINKIARYVAKKEKKLNGAVEFIVTDNKEIKKINWIWRGVDKSTDVLAFSWQENDIGIREELGQIFISYPKIISQAKDFDVSLKEEFFRIFIHGLLHLAGYNHQKEKEAKKMFKMQEDILSKTID
jgi:probable rRNA maturation factor